MRAGKTRKVTEMGRLVTRAQLQSAANQIGAVLIEGMAKLETAHHERLARIEKELGLNVEYAAPINTKPALVADEVFGAVAVPSAGSASGDLGAVSVPSGTVGLTEPQPLPSASA